MSMHTLIRSGRFYFWPIICANTVTMSLVLNQDLKRATMFSLVIALLASFGFLVNDLWDRDVDRVNRARHFENSNAVTIAGGIGVATMFLIAAFAVAYSLGKRELTLSVCIGLALAAYSVLLRKLLLVPTFLAAVLATSPLWSPLVLWADNRNQWQWLFIASIVTIVAARETFMDARDQPGDFIGGRDTMATIFGKKTAKFVATVLTLSGALPFMLAIAKNTAENALPSRIGAVFVGLGILYLLVHPAIRTVTDTDEHLSIRRYVLSSRIAMALIPILLLFWVY